MSPFNATPARQGWIEVIVGCMFSGKTEELIKQVRRARIAQQKVQAFKPAIDVRYSVSDVASHDQNKLASFPVESAAELGRLIDPAVGMVAIDEGQFFDDELVTVANALANSGRRVLIAGLDTDWRGRPFGPMPQLMAVADVVHKQHAVCRVCGAAATRTQRLVADRDDILVGSTESYEARCRQHFNPELTESLTATQHHLSLAEL